LDKRRQMRTALPAVEVKEEIRISHPHGLYTLTRSFHTI
jgi:hypothetical protein